jgi:thioredoxin reductase
MTSPMDLPLHGKLKLYETSKTELLDLWISVLGRHKIMVNENAKVETITHENGYFRIGTLQGHEYTSAFVLLAIGRRGTPRKLNIPGETKEKVAYRLLEPELISGKNIIVVGGGDSAVESAILLADNNNVTLSYRGDAFGRIKPQNNTTLNKFISENRLKVHLNSNLVSIEDDHVMLTRSEDHEKIKLQNDLVYIFAGGELPTQFLEKAGIKITKKFGEIVLKH